MVPDFDFSWTKFLTGSVGAAVSMIMWIGSAAQKITMGASGVAVSYFLTDWVAQKTGVPPGMSGFLLGLYGMMVAGKLWETLNAIDAKQVVADLRDWIKRRVGG